MRLLRFLEPNGCLAMCESDLDSRLGPIQGLDVFQPKAIIFALKFSGLLTTCPIHITIKHHYANSSCFFHQRLILL